MQFTQRPDGDEEDGDLDDQIDEQRDNTVSPVVIGAAVAGLLVGLLLWGSIALSAFSGMMGVFDDDDSPVAESGAEDTEGLPLTDDQTIDCDAFGPTRALSPEQEAQYQEHCVEPTPEPETESQEGAGDGAPEDASLNRENCDDIRGTDYRSAAEREWFLANCLD